VILLAKSEISMIHVRQALENMLCQRASTREDDFASSIKSAQEPMFVSSPSRESALLRPVASPALHFQANSSRCASISAEGV
jgi:hypothetical protein